MNITAADFEKLGFWEDDTPEEKITVYGMDFDDAYSVVISSLANVGPGIGMCGPAFSWDALPDAAKWLSTIYMLIGRLELFTVLLLLRPAFWRKGKKTAFTSFTDT